MVRNQSSLPRYSCCPCSTHFRGGTGDHHIPLPSGDHHLLCAVYNCSCPSLGLNDSSCPNLGLNDTLVVSTGWWGSGGHVVTPQSPQYLARPSLPPSHPSLHHSLPLTTSLHHSLSPLTHSLSHSPMAEPNTLPLSGQPGRPQGHLLEERGSSSHPVFWVGRMDLSLRRVG